jgi:hypothetical protein
MLAETAFPKFSKRFTVRPIPKFAVEGLEDVPGSGVGESASKFRRRRLATTVP